MNNQIQIKYREEYSGIRTFKTKYIAEVTHKGLNDCKILSSEARSILQNKVNMHVAKLDEKWDKIVHKQNINQSKEDILKDVGLRNREVQQAFKEINEILLYALDIDDTVNWEQLKNKSRYSIPCPENELPGLISKISKPTEPILLPYPQQPNKLNFQPKLTFFDDLIKSKKESKLQQANMHYDSAFNNWKNSCGKVDDANELLKAKFNEAILRYNKEISRIKENNAKHVQEWSIKKSEFLKQREEGNYKVTLLKEGYYKHNNSSVIEYCDLVLNNSAYPESLSFSKNFEIDYNQETKILVVEYSLPFMDRFPTVSEVKIVKGEVKGYFISESQLDKIFDETMYKIALRTIHELFEADAANAIEAVSFNGWIDAVNKATGKRENNCIISIQVKKSEFMQIDLRHVDAKMCFKNLKGVGSSKLSGLTAIQPILQISRNDARFINFYDVADSLDSSTNLAAMDWEDFEHLIREVFGKEFSSNGGEVKVTKASRDGGVDAIAFDPDPIRGGKIVIQAKRYTNTVGVSSVRDLYGTVMNEGATKGILVTTADFGPDAYEFVKGKPLTLMNGSNLLYLLEKHGHHARIDIREARQNFR